MTQAIDLDEATVMCQPQTLEINREYLLRIRRNHINDALFQPVKFIGFITCPGVILISENGSIQRVSRRVYFYRLRTYMI